MVRLILALLLSALAFAPTIPIHARGVFTWGTPVFSISEGTPDGLDFTTASRDSTGADFILICQAYTSSAAKTTPTDNKSNTYIPLTPDETTATRIQAYYVVNPTVGSGHTWSTGQPDGFYQALAIIGFSGTHATPFDQETHSSVDPDTSIQAGSLTPSENNALVVGCLAVAHADNVTVSGLTEITEITGTGNHRTLEAAYVIQTTAAAVNPTWTIGSASAAAMLLSFKTTGGGGGPAYPAAIINNPIRGHD